MANLNLQDKKFITPENLKLIINYGLGFASRVKNLEDKEITPFEADKLYTKDSLTIYDGYIYKAKVTNQSSTFNEIYWDLIGDDITELTKSDVEAMVGLSAEEIETLSKIILDSEIRLDKTFSSSKIYTDIQNAIDTAKAYTLSELGKISGASYKIANSTSEMTDEKVIYLLQNGSTYDMYIVDSGTPTHIGDTNIDLSNYYTKTEINNDFLKKADADSKYATINGLSNHVSDTVSHMTQTEKDKIITTDDVDISKLVIKDDIVKMNKENIVVYIPNEFTTLSSYIDTLTSDRIYFIRCTTDDAPVYNGNQIECLYMVIKHAGIYTRVVGYSMTGNLTWERWHHNGQWKSEWKVLCTTSVADVAETKLALKNGFNGDVFYRIVNGICYVTGQGVYATIIPSYEAPICNLPKHVLSSYYVRGVYDGWENKDESNINVVYIDSHTTILRGHFVSNKRTWFSFSYPVEES